MTRAIASKGSCLSWRLPADVRKSVDNVVQMVVLRRKVSVSWLTRTVSAAVDEAKAARWTEELQCAVNTGIMTPMLAEKFGGRLNFGVAVARNRVGRAFLGPFSNMFITRWKAGACALGWCVLLRGSFNP